MLIKGFLPFVIIFGLNYGYHLEPDPKAKKHRYNGDNPIYCGPQDISGFCIFPRDYKAAFGNLPEKVSKLIDLLPTGDYNFNHSDSDQWHTYQDMCDLEYVHENKEEGGGAAPSKKNSFKVDITEIKGNDRIWKNWLHLKITGGKMKIILVIATDHYGWPIGDFDNDMPCKDSCSCSGSCYVATSEDAVPCMFTPPYAVTHPGQLWIYNEGGLDEVHATWKFAQSSSIDVFAREIHFKTLLIVNTAGSQSYRRIVRYDNYQGYDPERKGIFGYTAIYPILAPSADTLGAWDYFGSTASSPTKVNCHKPIRKEMYESAPYPSYNGDYALGQARGLSPDLPSSLVGAQDCNYRHYNNEHIFQRNGSRRGYVGVAKIKDTNDCSFSGPDERFSTRPRIVPSGLISANNKLNEKLEKLVEWKGNEAFQTKERCTCTEGGNATFVHPLQIQGRKQHSSQMLFAWFFFVPVAIWVARYYKETYSKVFFLQEFWWFTVHLILLIIAAIFMLGGSYAIMLKRQNKYSEALKEWGVLAHFILGVLAMIFYWIHLIVGVYRPHNVKFRIVVIFLHWFFGMLEILLAFAAVIVTAWIRNGLTSCLCFYTIFAVLLVHIIFYTIMEIHMRQVDKKMDLKPKRRYLPPPVMRVFHTDAPKAKFRIQMLIAYVFFALLCVLVLYAFYEWNYIETDGMSCWDPANDDDLEEESEFTNERNMYEDEDEDLFKDDEDGVEEGVR